MKAIYLYVDSDPDQEAALQVALDLVRVQSGHLTCLQVTPVTELLMATDPLLGTGVEAMVASLHMNYDSIKSRYEARLTNEDVPWNWLQTTAEARWAAVHVTELADLIVIGRDSDRGSAKGPSQTVQAVVTNGSQPVLVVPPNIREFSAGQAALVAWDGSLRAARALRAAVPILQKSSAVHILTVEEKDTDFPAADASLYLSRHGVASTIHWKDRSDASVQDQLSETCRALGVGYVVMGAYSRSRAGEWLFGGVTRHMLMHSDYPLLMAH